MNVNKKAHCTAQRISGKDRYSEDLNKEVRDHCENYERAARNIILDSVRDLRYLQNLFVDEEKRFYCTNVLNDSTNYNEARQIREGNYCTVARRILVEQDLLGPHLTKFIEQVSCTGFELQKKYENTNILTPEVPKS